MSDEVAKRIAEFIAPFRVEPGSTVDLRKDGTIRHVMSGVNPRFPAVDEQARRDLLTVKADLEDQAPDGAAPDPFQQELAGAADARDKSGVR